MDEKYLTVSALTKYIKYKIDSDDNLRTVYLKGEISNFKGHSTGHYYFSIKDENSIIKAIMFKGNASKLPFIPKEGMKVFVTGSISIYEATGNYQIYVSDMVEDGVGNLYVAFEKLKAKLELEGLFDPKYKKKIPNYPKKIGIVTAKTGAAIKDIISTIKRRYPICETYLFPCLVQGENASKDITAKVIEADNYNLDVLIVGRGGGSFEDLNCFNDEELARTIFNAKTPIISAVGHEIDFTISDFVSDLRAPTPTGAAEMAVPNIVDLIKMINQYHIRINESIYKRINYNKLLMDSIKNSFVIKNPKIMFEKRIQQLDLTIQNLNNIMNNKILKYRNKLNNFKNNYILNNPDSLYKNNIIKLNNIIDKLELLNPLVILKRGYSITYKDSKMIKSINQIKKNDNLTIKIFDGNINVNVTEIVKE